jgi:putative transposase
VYDYRKMTPEQKAEAVEYRRLHEHPLHSPPHLQFHGQRQFFITGTCYEHQHHIGLNPERLTTFEADLLAACEKFAVSTTLGVSCRTTIMCCCGPTILKRSATSLDYCTDVRLTTGMVRRISAGGRYGSIALIA